ncbi:HNH endonuclease [Rhynchospora pubera]|uniref:HNH endonuclease n=1 Tax=Rhynchospora pubera TaxID=906938 RepID=A0AAV8BRJ0_9POAL|nr:HNH endonuclease [Rhynchospora pubera]
MARIASQGGLGLPFNCDLVARFKAISKRKCLESSIGISNGERSRAFAFRSGGKWRIGAVSRKKLSGGSKAEERYTEEVEMFDRELFDEVVEEASEEFERDELSCFRALVLDLSYRPVNIVCWKRALCLEFTEKADVLEYYEQTVSSPSGSFYIPAVLRVPHLLQVVKRRRIKQGLSRKNILFRDSYTCQYCSTRENLTIDHVIPTSRGGQWTWENLVAACARCNSTKGRKTLEEANMKLLKTPKAPKDFDILAIPLTLPAIKMLRSKKGVPDEWAAYLGKPKFTF